MTALLAKIETFLKVYYDQHSFLLDKQYFFNVVRFYLPPHLTLKKFISLLIFIGLIYYSSVGKKKTSFIKVIIVIAIINTCSAFIDFVRYYNDTILYENYYYYDTFYLAVAGPDNILSGLILTLVVSSCYRNVKKSPFLLGVTTHMAYPLLEYSANNDLSIFSYFMPYMVIRIIGAGIICWIISRRKHFYTSWNWYFGFHVFLKIARFYLDYVSMGYFQTVGSSIGDLTGELFNYLLYYKADVLYFGIVLVVALIFEKGVLNIQLEEKTA